MDELPPIRNLSLTQQRIRDALKNAPPLKIIKKSNDGFIVFDHQKKKSQDSLFDRFLKHKTMGSKNCSDSKDSKISGYKWSQLKDIMIEELEIKRMESQKLKDINEKIENEELDGVEDQLGLHLNEDIEENECNQKDLVIKQNDSSSDVSDEEEDEQKENEEEVEDEDEDSDEEEEDEESDAEVNPFINDEAEDDEESIKDVDERSDSSDSRDSLHIRQQKSQLIAEEECNEDNGHNDIMDTSFNVFDESFESRRCATQKIALSPFITQKPKPRFDSKNDFSELISDFNLNNEEFNSQSLLDLCSGDFAQNNGQNNFQKKTVLQSSQTNDSNEEQSDNNSDSEVDEEVLSRPKRRSQIFNIESDDESETEDKEIELKTTKEIKHSLKSFNESDGEELVVTDEEEREAEDDDNHEEQVEQNLNAFFDDEAELSGSDLSSDEDDADDEDLEEEDGDKEDLPSDSEIEEQNKKYFNKQILDEEKRDIMIMKERLFEDGDLHEDGRQRQKKFRWNLETDDNFVNDYINEDSDDNYMDSDEDEKTKTPTLRMSDHNSSVEKKNDNNLEKLKMNFKQNLNLKNMNTNIGSEAKTNSISAFVVRDKRLNTVLSFQSKRSLNSKNSFKSNKKLKNSKNSKTSIFDLLDPTIS